MIFFTLASANPASCASYTYKIYESITNMEVDSSIYTVNTQGSVPFIQFTLPGRDPWLGDSPFDLRIEAVYDNGSLTAADELEVSVFDTCWDTVVTPQNIAQLTTYVGKPQAVFR